MKFNDQDFAKFIIEESIIKFGQYTLKSGRISPYFFNFGSFDDAKKLTMLGKFYASAIMRERVDFDVLFGPAYKGIPISLATAIALFNDYNENVPFAFNRKEKKNYGEGGSMIGSSLMGKKVLAVDDVLTSGKTVKETKEFIESEGGTLTAFLVALDREEKGMDSKDTALEEISKCFGIHVYAVAGISNVVAYMEEHQENAGNVTSIKEYLSVYGKLNFNFECADL